MVVKLYLRHRLHAKLYLFHRQDTFTPIIGYLGGSNLTFAGLSAQGELNTDVLERDSATKLARWFEDRWADRLYLDITAELAEIIEESWARPGLISPYHIYPKMAYHLSQEAHTGQAEFRIPRVWYAKPARSRLDRRASPAQRVRVDALNPAPRPLQYTQDLRTVQ